jgi:hypothetical protein
MPSSEQDSWSWAMSLRFSGPTSVDRTAERGRPIDIVSGGGLEAAALAARDPEGTFTLPGLCAAMPGPPTGTAMVGEPAAATGDRDWEGTFTPSCLCVTARLTFRGYWKPGERVSYHVLVSSNVPDLSGIFCQVAELSLLPGGPRLRDPIHGF